MGLPAVVPFIRLLSTPVHVGRKCVEEAGAERTIRLQLRSVLMCPLNSLQRCPAGDFGVYEIQLRIRRLSGQSNTWVRINRGFLNEIRKQFLLWRTIAPEDKESYFSEAKEAFA